MATPRKKAQDKKKVGRKTKYNSDFNLQVKGLCLLGLTDVQIAGVFEVEEKTIHNWRKRFPEFLQSMKDGKLVADAAVAASLYERALGTTIKKSQGFKCKKTLFDSNGKKTEEIEKVEIVEYEEELPGDVTAQKKWLGNRQRENWGEKVQINPNGDAPFTGLIINYGD